VTRIAELPMSLTENWPRQQYFIDGQPVRWEFPPGVVHACEGTTYHGDVILWTFCEIDVRPPPKAFTPDAERSGEVTCPKCKELAAEAERRTRWKDWPNALAT
jgi:hypothetical protein